MMLSSADHRGDALRCRELGLAAYLSKPIRQSVLWDAIIAALGTSRAESPLPPVTNREMAPPTRPLEILLAEDNTVNQILAVRLLAKRGHTVTVAVNGRAAVEALERRPFDLVLMDVQMPEMDGFEATAQIRERERRLGGHVPILAMTAHALKGDRERCLASGMDGYVSKPLQVEQLISVVEGLIPGMTKGGLPDQPLKLDRAAVLSHFADDPQLFQEMLGVFARECPQQMAAIQAAIQAQNATQLGGAAHAFKGAIGNFGESPAWTTAQALESLGRENNLAVAAEAYERLVRQVTQLQSALAKLSPAEGA